jgi:phosphotransferase system IIB component
LLGLGLSIAKTLVEKMGGSIDINSVLHKGTCFSFQVTFNLASASISTTNFGPLVRTAMRRNSTPTSNVMPSEPSSMMPTAQELDDEYRLGRPPLRFLVVDDNSINKRLFERTVSHMFKQQKRKEPVYIFAADGSKAAVHKHV